MNSLAPARAALTHEPASNDWRSLLLNRIEQTGQPRSGWGYSELGSVAPEPTALACLALASARRDSNIITAALGTLASLQHSSGAVPASADAPNASWPTALALFAWKRCSGDDHATFEPASGSAVTFLLQSRGREAAVNPRLFDHDGTIPGWPWVDGAGAWVEPTAYALLALRAAGLTDNDRYRDGVRLIRDRVLPDGGWNYGNRRVIDNVLSPFPAPTGIALAALAGEPRDDDVDRSIAYLQRALERVRTPLSLAWGLIGLRAHDAVPKSADKWLRECAIDHLSRPAAPYLDALLTLAGAKMCLLAMPARAGEACVSAA